MKYLEKGIHTVTLKKVTKSNLFHHVSPVAAEPSKGKVSAFGTCKARLPPQAEKYNQQIICFFELVESTSIINRYFFLFVVSSPVS